MIVRNLISGAAPAVLHRNGVQPHWQARWQDILDAFFSEAPTPCAPCPELTVLTWSNGPAKTLVERSLDRWGVPCLTLGKGLPAWRNDMKLVLNVEALARIDSEYVMALDAFDVLVIAGLRQILDAFHAFDCELVFNAEKNNYPKVPFLAEFEESIAESPFRYLNSGAWIGKTDFCRRFFKDCLEEDNGDILGAYPERHISEDDQGLIRKTFRRYYPAVRLDYHCRIFQTLFKVPLDGEVLILPNARLQPSPPATCSSGI